MTAIVEERITFTSEGQRLCGVLAYPEEAAPAHAVLVCSPHPHFAGDMDNNVVRAVADLLARHSAVLRFDYRGVGDSEIDLVPDVSVFDYWTNVEESRDYADAMADVASAAQALLSATESLDLDLYVVGYSFGAATGMMFAQQAGGVSRMVALAPPLGKVSFEFMADCTTPSLHLVGKSDFLYSDEKVEGYRRAVGSAAEVLVVNDMDHFFRGDETTLAHKVDEFIRRTHAA